MGSRVIAVLVLFCCACGAQNAGLKLSVSSKDLDLLVNQSQLVVLNVSGNISGGIPVEGFTSHGGVVLVQDKQINVTSAGVNVTLKAVAPGHDVVYFNTSYSQGPVDLQDAFVRVTVGKSHNLAILSTVVGWIYFVAWSVSFYPQVYENWKRKSVVGLNFDFLSLNLMGFVLYSLFNCGLHWIPEMQAEYSERHPRGLNPVQLNDIFFSLHATAVTLLTILQCFLYERGDQRVSNVAKVILSVFVAVLLVSCILSGLDQLHWLDFLYICSYIKLAITLIKYIPQAYMNYRRKSTIGWSIGNVVLDFTGGILSMLQMLVNADNYNDWESIFGDPTKFGLGLFSVLFDIFFLIQHYGLYRNSVYEVMEGDINGEHHSDINGEHHNDIKDEHRSDIKDEHRSEKNDEQNDKHSENSDESTYQGNLP